MRVINRVRVSVLQNPSRRGLSRAMTRVDRNGECKRKKKRGDGREKERRENARGMENLNSSRVKKSAKSGNSRMLLSFFRPSPFSENNPPL